MATSTDSSKDLFPEQHLVLSDGRTIAYAQGGDPTSQNVAIFLHGVFGIGSISSPVTIFEEKKFHYINPTAPGWGNTSSPPPTKSYTRCLCEDITAILEHLHPNTEGLKIYLAGGSLGTVFAQILFGAPYDVFPYGKYVVGVLLLAPFSPPRIHKHFGKVLSWSNYFAIGPPSHRIPGNLIMKLGTIMFKKHVATPEKATAFIQDFGFQKMTAKEKEAYERWKSQKGLKEGDAQKTLGTNMYLSVRNTWDGFLAVPSIFHSDWEGYDPTHLDEHRAKVLVMIVVTHADIETLKMGEWLDEVLPNSYLRYEEGGHIASMFVMDDIWADFISRTSQ